MSLALTTRRPNGETAIPPGQKAPPMLVTPLQSLVGGLVDFVVEDPLFVGLVVVILAFVFFMYLFVRRTVTGLRDGFDEGYRGK
jgi:hypothetical protein